MNRSCGGCTECCTGQLHFQDKDMNGNIVVATSELGCTKFANGCTIYEDRPETCRSFQCMYTIDVGLPESLKPSVCGFITHRYSAESLGDSDNARIVFTQNKNGPDIDEQALIFGLWWAMTQTNDDVELSTRKFGHLRFR